MIVLPEGVSDRTHAQDDVKVVAYPLNEEGEDVIGSVNDASLLSFIQQCSLHLYGIKNCSFKVYLNCFMSILSSAITDDARTSSSNLATLGTWQSVLIIGVASFRG